MRTIPDGPVSPVAAAAVDVPDIDLTDPAAVSNALHDAFVGALEQQAGTRHRHAVLLGGFDSALVAAGLRRLGHEVDCYTFGFADPTYEQRNVDVLTKAIGAQHHWVQFSPDVIGGLLGWDLSDFSRRLSYAAPMDDTRTMERRHLERAGIVAALGLGLALLSSIIHFQRLAFEVAVGLLILAVLGLTRLVIGLRR